MTEPEDFLSGLDDPAGLPPAPPVTAVVARGHALRVRRQMRFAATFGLAAVAVVAVACGALPMVTADRLDNHVTPADSASASPRTTTPGPGHSGQRPGSATPRTTIKPAAPGPAGGAASPPPPRPPTLAPCVTAPPPSVVPSAVPPVADPSTDPLQSPSAVPATAPAPAPPVAAVATCAPSASTGPEPPAPSTDASPSANASPAATPAP